MLNQNPPDSSAGSVNIKFRQNIAWALEHHPDEFEEMFVRACKLDYRPMMLKQPGYLGTDILVRSIVGYEYTDRGRNQGYRVWVFDGKAARTLAINSTHKGWQFTKGRVLMKSGRAVADVVLAWLRDRGWQSLQDKSGYCKCQYWVWPSLDSAACTECSNYMTCVLERG